MRTSRRAAVWAALAAACTPALGADFQAPGGLQLRLHGVVTLGTQLRTQSPSPDAYSRVPGVAVGAPTGNLQGQTGGGDLNYGRGDPIATVVKAVVDLDLKRDNLGLFVRASAWNDFVQGQRGVPYGNYPSGFIPNAPLSDRGFSHSARFDGAQMGEAYAYGSFKLDDGGTLAARLGRQVLPWGGARLVTGGIGAAINPVDAAAQVRPGAQLSEARVPVAMLHAALATGGAWRLEGFTAFESRMPALPGCGTYFDVASYAPQGCNFAALATAGFERDALASGNYLHRTPDVAGRSSGQFGVAAAWQAPGQGGDLRLYALRVNSTTPSLRMTVNAATPGILASSYAVSVPRDVSLFGASFSRRLDARTETFGEIAYRPNQPINLSAYDLLLGFVTRSPASVMALNKGILAIPVGGTFDAYDRFGVITASVGASQSFTGVLGAARAQVQGEVGLSHVNGLPDIHRLRYGRTLPYSAAGYTGGPACVDAVPGKTCTGQGYVSRDAWGLRVLASATYTGAPGGGTLTPSLLVARDMRGWSFDGAFSEGRLMVRPGLRADWRGAYFADLQYMRFAGGKYNLLVDRDFVAMTVGARF